MLRYQKVFSEEEAYFLQPPNHRRNFEELGLIKNIETQQIQIFKEKLPKYFVTLDDSPREEPENIHLVLSEIFGEEKATILIQHWHDNILFYLTELFATISETSEGLTHIKLPKLSHNLTLDKHGNVNLTTSFSHGTMIISRRANPYKLQFGDNRTNMILDLVTGSATMSYTFDFRQKKWRKNIFTTSSALLDAVIKKRPYDVTTWSGRHNHFQRETEENRARDALSALILQAWDFVYKIDKSYLENPARVRAYSFLGFTQHHPCRRDLIIAPLLIVYNFAKFVTEFFPMMMQEIVLSYNGFLKLLANPLYLLFVLWEFIGKSITSPVEMFKTNMNAMLRRPGENIEQGRATEPVLQPPGRCEFAPQRLARELISLTSFVGLVIYPLYSQLETLPVLANIILGVSLGIMLLVMNDKQQEIAEHTKLESRMTRALFRKYDLLKKPVYDKQTVICIACSITTPLFLIGAGLLVAPYASNDLAQDMPFKIWADSPGAAIGCWFALVALTGLMCVASIDLGYDRIEEENALIPSNEVHRFFLAKRSELNETKQARTQKINTGQNLVAPLLSNV